MLAIIGSPRPMRQAHKTREYPSMVVLLRNRLKYALTYREVVAIVMQRLISMDGKVRTDKCYHAGFMDVVSIAKTGGNFRGRIGIIKHREKHKGSFEILHVQDTADQEFSTQLGNVFTIGKGIKPWVTLPRGKGIKLSIVEEAKKKAGALKGTVA
ncbi:hypothetical protein GOP47_0001515 [Adiantum capillus-veneris]|uniref:Small ribosomal subunit protein eS4 C-terminal domain-containing protein n=1 Tax=Adiantum capillus-veneris TaxID=13818 RepID=A0A9D4ZQ66_ADICA|nr:hypothetical protein GOP47_0001515 [Adiantum capillus-veneris]